MPLPQRVMMAVLASSAMTLGLLGLGQAQQPQAPGKDEPVPEKTAPPPQIKGAPKPRPAQEILQEALALEPQPSMTLETGLKLVKPIEELRAAINTQKDIPIPVLSKIAEASIIKFYYSQASVPQFYQKGGRALTDANLNLQSDLIAHLKTRKEPGAPAVISRLKGDLVWYIDNYPDQTVHKQAANHWIEQFFPEGDLATMNKGMSELKSSANYRKSSRMLLSVALPRLDNALSHALKQLKTETDTSKRLEHLNQVITSQSLMAEVLQSAGGDVVDKAQVKTIYNKHFDAAYVAALQKGLLDATTLEERLKIGESLGIGTHIEGAEHAEKGMSRQLYPHDALLFAPPMFKEDRHGKVGPFTRLLLDLDRVAFFADQKVFSHFSGKILTEENFKQYRQFNRNAVSAYLKAGHALSRDDGNNANLLGLMTIRFLFSMERDFYRKSQVPDPAVWGEHVGLFLGMKGGKRPNVTDEAFLKSKINHIKRFLTTDYTWKDEFLDKTVKQEGLFTLYRWNRQYWLLVEKGVKNPHEDREKAQKLIDDPAFQKELDARVEAGWQAFERGLATTAPSPAVANQLLEALGRTKKGD